MDAWPLGRYLKSVSLLLAIRPSHMCLPLLSASLIPLLRSMFFPRYDVVRVYYKDKLVLQMYTTRT